MLDWKHRKGTADVLEKENEAGGKASVMPPFVHGIPRSVKFSSFRKLFRKDSRPIVSGYWRRLLVFLFRIINKGWNR